MRHAGEGVSLPSRRRLQEDRTSCCVFWEVSEVTPRSSDLGQLVLPVGKSSCEILWITLVLPSQPSANLVLRVFRVAEPTISENIRTPQTSLSMLAC